jgi:hypothetical protein
MPAEGSFRNELRLLDPKKVQIRIDENRRLRLEIGIEERYGPVRAVRSLPLSQPDKFVSIQDDDFNEIGLIPDLRQLDAESRKAVEGDLVLYYLVAHVERINKVEAKHGVISWELETNLGPRRAHIRDRQHIRSLPDGRTILTDIHEAKYEIPPLSQLDERSRHCLEVEM